MSLTAICLLAPHLTAGNHRLVLEAARQKGKRDVERMIAELSPKPDVPSTIRKLPSPAPPVPMLALAEIMPAAVDSAPTLVRAAPQLCAPQTPSVRVAPAPSRPLVVVSLAPERFKVQFTVGRETHDKLRRAQDLLRHAAPNGDPAQIVDRALTLLLEVIPYASGRTASVENIQLRCRAHNQYEAQGYFGRRGLFAREPGDLVQR